MIRVESISETKCVGWGACHRGVLTLLQHACNGHFLWPYATVMPKMGFPIRRVAISRINHDEKKIFSRSVLASSENFAFVNGAILPNV